MSTTEKQALVRRLAEGRARAKRQADREAIARVKAFRRWLRSGSVLRSIPAIPTDADFKLAEARKRVTA